ncbi:MAG: hypothetical protein WCL06_00440 [Bacteroidota bacterium]
MAKPKASTLQQKLGFFDEDLKHPDHDSILKWVDSNIETVINTIYNFKEWEVSTVNDLSNQVNAIVIIELEREKEANLTFEKEITKLQNRIDELNEKLLTELEKEEQAEKSNYIESKWTKNDIEKAKLDIEEKKKEYEANKRKIKYLTEFPGLSEKLPARQKPKVIERIWEYTVTNQSSNPRTGYQSTKNVIGFIDMKVSITFTQLNVAGINLNQQRISGKLDWTQTDIIDSRTGKICPLNLFIEVKTKIQSLGELFRQLNTYKEYLSGDFIVICPDDSNKDTIINQGFKFYKFEG